jgi:hypothetical protein
MFFGGRKFSFIANPLQNLGENETTATDILALMNGLLQFFSVRGFLSLKEIDPHS